MTDRQREDLWIEWQVTSSRVKEQITGQYRDAYGEKLSEEHWEEFLVEALNLRQSWEASGLA